MLYGLLSLVILALDIIAIVEIVRGGMSSEKKLLWIILIILLPLLGLILYYLLGRPD